PTPGIHAGGLAYMVENGFPGDLTLASNGDYCNYYRTSSELRFQDGTDEGPFTGLTTPTPFSSYQEGDKASGAWNVCQAYGASWGQSLRGPEGKGCIATCGMHHFVSLRAQGGNERPWAPVFGEPALIFSADATVSSFTHTGKTYGGWGYL